MSFVSPSIRSLAFVSLLALAACPRGGAKGTAAKEPVIGVVAALTGPNAQYGQSMRDGIELALRERMNKGASPVRAIYLDDQSRTADAGLIAQKLITDEGADVLLGGVSSSGSLVMAPIAERAHVPMITPSATEPSITDYGEFVFRACFTDPFQAQAMAKYAKEKLAFTRVAIVRDLGSEYSIGLAKAFKESFEALGGAIPLDEHYAREDEDWAALAAKLAGSDVQAIYVPGYATEIAKLARAARAANVTVPLLGGDGFDAHRLLSANADVLEGSYFTTHWAPEDPAPEVERFVRAYSAAYNEVPDAIAALGYDAAGLALAAIARAGTADKDALRRAIADTRGYAGVTGPIAFDAKRNPIKPAVVVKIAGGKRTFAARLSGD